MTAGGDARAPPPERGAAPAHAPGRGGGGTAADPIPTPAAEGTVTATSRAPDTSECSHHWHKKYRIKDQVVPLAFFNFLQLVAAARTIQIYSGAKNKTKAKTKLQANIYIH